MKSVYNSSRKHTVVIMQKIIFYCTLSICVTLCAGGREQSTQKVIIDNDAGGDDAMAIFLALLYEKYFDGPEIIALTTGNGNTDENNVCINNQQILKIAKRQDIPIYRGSKTSLVTTPASVHYYGHDGMGDNNEVYSGLIEPHKQNAITALIELSKEHEGKLSVITIGTLSNIAIALKYDADFLNRLAHLYVGAGHIYSSEDPAPEFNALMDVEGYHVVMQYATPDKVTIFPYSQTRAHCNFSRDWRINKLGSLNTTIMRNQNKHERVSLKKSDRWLSLDPSVVATTINPDLVKEYKYVKNDIIMCGDQRGINTNKFVEKDKANARMVFSVKTEEYRQFLMEVFSAGD
ncbi:uncharacterized protein C1683.06c [Manduca sexta]|uniref:uncharacterized protein C1683.06c n=1 Tax=Manduca sexta TaxID=7130 RepID=UPI00188ED64D|nr:uncharacterized protein C1683.06c [Manduca sexta]